MNAIDALFKVPKAELVAVLLNCYRPSQYVLVMLKAYARYASRPRRPVVQGRQTACVVGRGAKSVDEITTQVQ